MPIPTVHAITTTVRYRRRPHVLVKTVVVSGLTGLLRVTCDGCLRRTGPTRRLSPAKGTVVFQGVNWLLLPGHDIAVRTYRSGAIGRYELLAAGAARGDLVFKATGCLRSLTRRIPCPKGVGSPTTGGPVPQPAPGTVPPPTPVAPPAAVAPSTRIVSGPTGTVTTLPVHFTYSSPTASTFECSLDGAVWALCPAAGISYGNLAPGSHMFRVRAVAGGLVDAAPPERSWTQAVPVPVSAQPGASKLAVQADTGNLWTLGPGGGGDRMYGMAIGTSPSIAPSGEVAFQANTGNLWVIGPGTPGNDLKLGMAAGTSPSIAPSGVVAFQANTGSLWVVGHGATGNQHYGMARGTSPSISPSGEVAFQANTGNLWTIGPGGIGDRKLGMAAGTSPSIAPSGAVAFQANTGSLWVVGPGAGGDQHYGMARGTSPSISPSGEVAFQANTGRLWTIGPGGHGDLGYGMAAGTSPSISPSGEIAFQADTHVLWTVGSTDDGDHGLAMRPGTSPSINR